MSYETLPGGATFEQENQLQALLKLLEGPFHTSTTMARVIPRWAALEEAPGGTTITVALNGGGQSPYAVTGYSAQLQQALAGVLNLPPENSGAWEGLLSLYFNSPKLLGRKLIAALNSGDLAEGVHVRYLKSRTAGRQISSGSERSLAIIIAMIFLGSVAPLPRTSAQMPGEATYSFRLIRGKGTPVCDAFLKRLQLAKFTKPPYCAIPDDTTVSGFTPLHPVPITEKEIMGLFAKVEWFTYKQNQNIGPYPGAAEEVHMHLGRTLFAWRYDPPLSVDNDRKPENVLVWQGTDLYYDDSEFPCGWPASGMSVIPYRTRRIALILAENNVSRVIEISPAGTGLHWPKLDADLYIPALLSGVLGNRRWMARLLGQAGGQS